MNELLEIKRQQIDLLQTYTSWGKGKEVGEQLLRASELSEINEDDSEEWPRTKILINTNKITSPINIDLRLELPIVELYLDEKNFVVYTTSRIYSFRNAAIVKIEYKHVISIDEDSLNSFFRNWSKKVRFFDIRLITKNGHEIITIEYGIPFQPLVRFLTNING